MSEENVCLLIRARAVRIWGDQKKTHDNSENTLSEGKERVRKRREAKVMEGKGRTFLPLSNIYPYNPLIEYLLCKKASENQNDCLVECSSASISSSFFSSYTHSLPQESQSCLKQKV